MPMALYGMAWCPVPMGAGVRRVLPLARRLFVCFFGCTDRSAYAGDRARRVGRVELRDVRYHLLRRRGARLPLRGPTRRKRLCARTGRLRRRRMSA
jgi:hypothetical protein